jgi:hypothetical protein
MADIFHSGLTKITKMGLVLWVYADIGRKVNRDSRPAPLVFKRMGVRRSSMKVDECLYLLQQAVLIQGTLGKDLIGFTFHALLSIMGFRITDCFHGLLHCLLNVFHNGVTRCVGEFFVNNQQVRGCLAAIGHRVRAQCHLLNLETIVAREVLLYQKCQQFVRRGNQKPFLFKRLWRQPQVVLLNERDTVDLDMLSNLAASPVVKNFFFARGRPSSLWLEEIICRLSISNSWQMLLDHEPQILWGPAGRMLLKSVHAPVQFILENWKIVNCFFDRLARKRLHAIRSR